MTGDALGWDVDARDHARIVAPTGRIDEGTATAFSERLAEEILHADASGTRLLAIDLAGIDYMSSRGLRGLTLAQRKGSEHEIRIVLARPNAILREILAISRYDLVFGVFDTIDDALSP